MSRLCLALVPLALSAEPARGETSVTVEGGAEGDSNTQRVEARPGVEPIASPVLRLGGTLEHRSAAVGGTLAAQLSGQSRVITRPAGDAESAALVLADARWVHGLRAQRLAAGVAASAVDAAALADPVGTRTFRSLGADALVVLRGGEDRVLTIAAGARAFRYKPDHAFDYDAPAANLRLDLVLWEASSGARSVELAVHAGIEARAYNSTAFASVCPDDAMPSDPRTCFAPTTLSRHDRYTRLGTEVTWTGAIVAAAGYQLAATDSNSFGQSFLRHRFTLSATVELPRRIYATGLATLQLDQYLDGLIVQSDITNQTFTTLDDENRSSLQLRLARALTAAWSVEGRAAIWRDLGGDSDVTFRRAIVYGGVIYSR
jgi:hypothetical protein